MFGLGLDQHVAEVVVEAAHDLAGKLQVGGLIHAHRDDARLVEGDVGGHQHRVADEAVVNVVGLLAHFILERGQPGEPAQGGHHRKQEMQFGYLGHVGLDEDDGALFRVHTSGQPVQGHLIRPVT